MVGFAVIAIFVGLMTILGLYLWIRQREAFVLETASNSLTLDQALVTDGDKAMLVATQHGQIVHINDAARDVLGIEDGIVDLEYAAARAEPQDLFLNLFTSQSRAAFQMRGRWVEASSHHIPSPEGPRVVVMLDALRAGDDGGALDVSRVMTVINEIGAQIEPDMGIEPALSTLLQIILGQIDADAGEIALLDRAQQILTQRGWVGDAMYVLALSEQGGTYPLKASLPGWVVSKKQPLLVRGKHEALESDDIFTDSEYQSALLVPLQHNDRLLGSLALYDKDAEAFDNAHMALLEAVRHAVSTAITSVEKYSMQESRLRDISSIQQITSSEDTDTTPVYETLTARIARLIEADVTGIFLYDQDASVLEPQRPFQGIADSIVDRITIQLPPGTSQRTTWQSQPQIIAANVTADPFLQAVGLTDILDTAGVRNLALFPMQIGAERIGALMVANKHNDAFTQPDVDSIQVLAAQAAIVAQNVRLYQQEQRIDSEIMGLQEMTRAIGAVSAEGDVYGEIAERIGRLMNSEMSGILLWNEAESQLEARLPFYGVDTELIQDYAIPVPSGSVMDELWREEETWYSNRVASDALVYAAGLDEIAERLGVKRTMIAVMATSGRRIGAVQVSNKVGGADFTENDARMLRIFAAQAAAIVENARLIREVQIRAEQADGLRRIAEIASTVITTEQSFEPVLREISKFSSSPIVYISTVDNTANTLITDPRWTYGFDLPELVVHDMSQPEYRYSVARSGRPFMGNDILNDERVLSGYRSIAERFGLRKAVHVPLVVGDRILGELGIANRSDRDYIEEDVSVLQAVAAQIAAAVERLLIYEATGENLRRRIDELDAISRVSNELTLTVDLDRNLQVVCEETEKATDADGSTLVMFHAPDTWEAPDQPAISRRIGIGDETQVDGLLPVERRALVSGEEVVIVADYDESPLDAVPDGMRSAAAVPVMYTDQVIGVLHIFARESNRFDGRAAGFLLTMATKASLAYQNAEYYQQQMQRGDRLRQRVDQLNRIFELGQMIQSDTDSTMMMEAIAYSIQQSVGFDTVVMLMVDEDAGLLRRVAHAGYPLEAFEQTRDDTISVDALQQVLSDTYRQTADTYFFPFEAQEDWYIPEARALSTSFEDSRHIISTGPNGWRDGDLLLVRVAGQRGGIIGMIALDRPYSNKRPDRQLLEVLEIFAHQASTMIENTRLFAESARSAEQEAQLNIIASQIASTLELSDIAESVAGSLNHLFPLSRLTLAVSKPQSSEFSLIQAVMQPDATIDVTQQDVPELHGAARRTFDERAEYLYDADSPEMSETGESGAFQTSGERASLFMPLIAGGEAIGVLHTGSTAEYALSDDELRTMLTRISQLLSSTVQNARLFEQAVNLQVLNRSVVESIQQGIVVLDDAGRIINVNEFMRDRYGWDAAAQRQTLAEYRPELAAFLQRDLDDVLHGGEPRELLNQEAASASGEMLISNFYLYPLVSQDAVLGVVMLVEDVTDRTRLEQAIESRANQLAALTEVSTRITASLDRGSVIDVALQEAGNILPADAVSVWERTGQVMTLQGYSGSLNAADVIGTRIEIDEDARLRQIVDTQRTVHQTGDIKTLLPDDAPAQSWLGVPLVTQGQVSGILVLSSAEPDLYESREEQYVAFAFGSQVAVALANAMLFEETFARTNELGTLLEAARATSIATDLNDVFRVVADLMFGALGMEDCTIMIWHEVENELVVQFSSTRSGETDSNVPIRTRYNVREYPARARALSQRNVIVILDADEDEQQYEREIAEMRTVGRGARMLVPLVFGEQTIGLILLQHTSSDPESITDQQVSLASALGTQMSSAIYNARLSSETRSRFEELLTINQLSQSVSSTLRLEDMIPIIRAQVPQLTRAEELYLALYDAETERITFPLAVRGNEEFNIEPRQLGDDEVSYIIKRKHTLSLGADYFTLDDLRRSMGIVNGEGDVKSYMGVPLLSGDEVLGVLAIRNRNVSRAFNVNDDRILSTVGAQLGAAIQNARLFEQVTRLADDLEGLVEERTNELEDERDRLDTLYQITSELARTLDMSQLLDRALDMVGNAVNADDGVILLVNPATDKLTVRAALNPDNVVEDEETAEAQHPAESLAEWLLQQDIENQRIIIVDDLRGQSYWDATAPGVENMRSALAVLLENNEDPMGVMVLLSEQDANFSEEQLKLLIPAANQVAASINSADLYNLIRDQTVELGKMLRVEMEEAQKNNAILESIADGVMLADAEGVIRLFNSAAERILQIPRDQAIGQNVSRLAGIYGTAAARWSQMIARWTVQGEAGDLTSDYVVEQIELGDAIVALQLAPVYIGDQFLGTVSVFRDITQEVETSRIKSQFIENVSHEFRTPLTPIKGYTDLLLVGAAGDLTTTQKDMITTIKDNVERLTVLVNDVLNIAKADRGETLRMEMINLRDVIEPIVERIAEKPANADMTYAIDIGANIPQIRADREKFGQIIANIVDNAFNYTPAGGHVELDIELDNDERNITIRVSDNGLGIPEDFKERIWNRFERYEQHALELDVSGTGLGLSLVRELVLLHYGRVWFESTPGEGTTFFIRLPVEQPAFAVTQPIELPEKDSEIIAGD